MLAYRHAFHAGNAADVLKHTVLLEVLARMAAKDKGFLYVDTHAGAGSYRLGERMAQRLAEHERGVGALWRRDDAPPAVAAYLAAIRAFNRDGVLRVYPGSPRLAAAQLREQDSMVLFELHPSDYRALRAEFGADAQLRPEDGFNGLKALLPPPTRRGVVLIDPSYELDSDYTRVLGCLRDALTRFATGVYVVWYPQLQSLESSQLPRRLKALAPAGWLHAQLTTDAPRADGFGLLGSGMFVINPPYGLRDALAAALPWLAAALGAPGVARWVLDAHEP